MSTKQKSHSNKHEKYKNQNMKTTLFFKKSVYMHCTRKGEKKNKEKTQNKKQNKNRTLISEYTINIWQ